MTIPRISLEDFAVDPQLGNFNEASPGQRLALRLLDGLPPADTEQRDLFETIAGRPWGEDLRAPRRVVALVMGADSGKSIMAAELLLHRALFGDVSALRPGQRAVGLLVAPDTRLAGIPLCYVKGILDTSALVRAELDGEPAAETIRFKRGTEVAILPATLGGRAVRGRRFVAAVLEETAFFRDRDFAVNDVDIVRAVRPRLLPGAQLVAISTPWRKTGYLYDLHRAEFGQSKGALVLQAATGIMRPDKRAADLEREFADDPISAAAELGAQFLEGVDGLFGVADLEGAIDEGVQRRGRVPGFAYVAATDPSGLRNDPWAFCIVGRRDDGAVVQFVTRAWLPGSSVERIVAEIKAELAAFGLGSVVSDQYGSEVTRAHFTAAGVQLEERAFTSGPSSPKTMGFKALRDLVVSGRIRLLDDETQRRELQLLEVTRLSGGGERIAAPGRLHDDRACALALAVGEIATPAPHQGILDFIRAQRAAQFAARGVTHVDGVPVAEIQTTN
ncbi:MAG: hypothetical protein LAO51_04495 [Acidobacteriia bacterium]|nr:hypothetical protein [Terriglobia bacterium]